MAQYIKHKNGTSDPGSSDFNGVAELLVNTTDGGLFTKDDSANIVEIGTVKPNFTGKVTQTSTAVSALDIDCSTSNYFTKAISADSTFTFSNVPSNGQAYGFVLELDVSGDRTLTWPAAVKWNGGSAPTLTADKTHLFSLVTVDNGTTWRASAIVDFVT